MFSILEVVAPLLHAYVYGGVPPVTKTSVCALFPSLQSTAVLSKSISNLSGCCKKISASTCSERTYSFSPAAFLI